MYGSKLQALLQIRLPNALPYFFAGSKVAISLALVAAIAGEFIASQTGLCSAILIAQGMFRTERVFVCLILLGIYGIGAVLPSRIGGATGLSLARFSTGVASMICCNLADPETWSRPSTEFHTPHEYIKRG